VNVCSADGLVDSPALLWYYSRHLDRHSHGEIIEKHVKTAIYGVYNDFNGKIRLAYVNVCSADDLVDSSAPLWYYAPHLDRHSHDKIIEKCVKPHNMPFTKISMVKLDRPM
jgi:hypothetical protein